MRKTILIGILFTATVLATPAKAQLLLSNWNITGDTLFFDITGTYTAPESPSENAGLLWLAEVGNNSWINDDTNPDSFTITGDINGYDAATNDPTVFSFNGEGDTNVGAYLDFGGMPPFDPGIQFDFTSGTDDVNIHVEMTFTESSGTKYNPASINPANLQLYWGGDAFSGNATGAVPMDLSAVPEPSSYGLIGLAAVVLISYGLQRRRIRL